MPTTTPNPAELAAFPNRRAVEREIEAAENQAPDTMYLSDGHERIRLPGGTLRRMLAVIDQLRDLASGPSAGAAEYVLQLLLAAGHVTAAQVEQARQIAEKVNPAPAATPPAEKEVRVPLTDEQIEAGEDEFGDDARAPDYYLGFYQGIKFAEREHGISAAALSTDGSGHER